MCKTLSPITFLSPPRQHVKMESVCEEWGLLMLRYGSLIDYIDERYPGFWSDVGDTMGRIRELMVTTRGATVRNLPSVQEVGVQTDLIGSQIRIRTPTGTGWTQTELLGGQIRTRSRTREAVQYVHWVTPHRDAGQQTDPEMEPILPRTRTPERRERQQPPITAMLPRGCWNCGGNHRFAACTQPRRDHFCYGCGHVGTTVKDCPRCGPTYNWDSPIQTERGPRRSAAEVQRGSYDRASRDRSSRRNDRLYPE